MRSIAWAGVRRVSRSASAPTGSSMRCSVVGSSSVIPPGAYTGRPGRLGGGLGLGRRNRRRVLACLEPVVDERPDGHYERTDDHAVDELPDEPAEPVGKG